MSGHKLNEGKPEYGEPFNVTGEHKDSIRWLRDTDGFIVFRVGRENASEEYRRRRSAIAERVCNLINLFTGVSDEHINELSDFSTNTNNLIRTLLLNPLESVPLVMLVDEIQETPEYQKQVGCYRSWLELYHKLLEIADMIDPDTKRYDYELIRTARRSLASEIRNFLAPVRGFIESTKPYPLEEKTIGIVGTPCHRCTVPNFYPNDLDDRSRGCQVCWGRGVI